MEINKMIVQDVEEIHNLECECFSMPWSLNGIKTELENENAYFFVAKDNGKVIGYIGSYIMFDECAIANVAVTNEYRKKGVASSLLEKLIEIVKTKNVSSITLEVRKSNSSAISLYNKYLFIKQGIRKNCYQYPIEDAIVMTRKLKEEEVN